MKPGNEWHKAFFRNSFYNPASPAALSHAPREAAFMLRRLNLARGAALLDLCCGPGRHSVEFARKGLKVTGYDFSKEYLAEAAARARRAKVTLRLARGDMRALPYRGEFDAAVNAFTSFGYFTRRADDLKTLRGVARALKPGGLFLVDIINGAWVRRNFRPRDWRDLGACYQLEESRLERDGSVNTWTRVPKAGGRAVTRVFFTRLYDRAALTAALLAAGLSPLRFWGGFDGRPLSASSVRLVALARKGNPA